MNSDVATADVVVVGGAIAGSALGNAFGRLGLDVLIIEKASREVHSARGDVLQPPTLRILQEWGLLDDLHADGTQPLLETRIIHAERGELGVFPITPQDDTDAGTTVALPHDRIEGVLYRGALRLRGVRETRGTVSGLLRRADGRVTGVRLRPADSETEVEIAARLVVGADGGRSLVRRELGIEAEPTPYQQDIVVVAGEGLDEHPNSIRWYFDDIGLLSVVPRPRGEFRFLWLVPGGKAPAVLREPDPALYNHLVARFPQLARLRFGRDGASVYKVARHVADRFAADGAAIAGDAAHSTNPAGGSGMNLAMTDALALARIIGPVLTAGGSDTDLDAALAAYDAERRPASERSVMVNDERALAPYRDEVFKRPDDFLAMWSRTDRRPAAPAAPATA